MDSHLEKESVMARFQIQFETTTKAGVKSGVVGTTIEARTASEARQKLKANHSSVSIRIISVVQK